MFRCLRTKSAFSMISEIQYICKITEKTNFAKYGALLGSDVSKIVGTPLRATCALATRTYLCACFFFLAVSMAQRAFVDTRHCLKRRKFSEPILQFYDYFFFFNHFCFRRVGNRQLAELHEKECYFRPRIFFPHF